MTEATRPRPIAPRWVHPQTGHLIAGLEPGADGTISITTDAIEPLLRLAGFEPEPDHETRLREAADSLGIPLTPWQLHIGTRLLRGAPNGVAPVISWPRSAGRTTLEKVIAEADRIAPKEPE